MKPLITMLNLNQQARPLDTEIEHINEWLRKNAVGQAKRLRAGEPVCDFLALETRAAKKYLRQCERRDKQQATKRDRKIAFQMSRRAGMSELLSRTQGQPNLCVGKPRRAGKDSLRSGAVTMNNNTERERLSLAFEQVPVPEPTPIGFEHHAVHGKQRVSWARGNPKATLQKVTNRQK